MGHAASDETGFRWVAWPCSACSGGVTAIGFLGRCREANPSVLQRGIEEITSFEIACLRQWVDACPHTLEIRQSLPLVAEGSEHRVYFDDQTAEVWKTTKPGLFGENYYIEDDKVAQKNCSPIEYLTRLHIWKDAFGSAPTPIGLTPLGQIVSRHEYISGRLPTQSDVDSFLRGEGFVPVKQKFWLWEKIDSESGLKAGLGDARDENFVETPQGIVPIDVRLWYY